MEDDVEVDTNTMAIESFICEHITLTPKGHTLFLPNEPTASQIQLGI